jgi:hypothetical protein
MDESLLYVKLNVCFRSNADTKSDTVVFVNCLGNGGYIAITVEFAGISRSNVTAPCPVGVVPVAIPAASSTPSPCLYILPTLAQWVVPALSNLTNEPTRMLDNSGDVSSPTVITILSISKNAPVLIGSEDVPVYPLFLHLITSDICVGVVVL